MPYNVRVAILLILTGSLFAALWIIEPIPQDPLYHQFADFRMFWGIPNALNVITNLPFLLVGILGLKKCFRSLPNVILFAAIFLTGIGSSYYHLDPNSQTLLWDRLPMAIGFIAFLDIIISEHLGQYTGRITLLPLLILGVGSVLVWYWLDDLRLYAAVQFGSFLLILVIVWLFPNKKENSLLLFGIFGWYGLAKLFEYLDFQIFALGNFISGHSLKHLAAALATYWILLFLQASSDQ